MSQKKRPHKETSAQSSIPDLILPRVSRNDDPENFYWTTTGFYLSYPALSAPNTTIALPTLYSSHTGGAQTAAASVSSQVATGQWTCISESCNLVQLGTASYQRKGRAILVNRFELKAVIYQQQNIDQVAPGGVIEPANIVTIQIWLDTQYNSATGLTTTDSRTYVNSLVPLLYEVPNVANDTGITVGSLLAFPNRSYQQRFILLKEVSVTFNAQTLTLCSSSINSLPYAWTQGTPGNTPYQPNAQASNISIDINNIQIPIMFDDTQSAGTLQTVTSNNIFIMANSYGWYSNPQIHHNSRITYKQLP